MTPMGVVFGFQLSARDDANGQAGNLASLDNSTSVNTAGGVQYLGHNITPKTEGMFDFEWTPPPTDVGTVTMYVAADADNGNQGPDRQPNPSQSYQRDNLPRLLACR